MKINAIHRFHILFVISVLSTISSFGQGQNLESLDEIKITIEGLSTSSYSDKDYTLFLKGLGIANIYEDSQNSNSIESFLQFFLEYAQTKVKEERQIGFFQKFRPYIDELNTQNPVLNEFKIDYYSTLSALYLKNNLYDSLFNTKAKQIELMLSRQKIDSISVAKEQSNLSVYYYRVGDLNKAYEYTDASYQIRRNILSEDDPRLAFNYKWLGVLKVYQNFAGQEAIDYFNESLRIYKKNYGINSAQVVDALNNLSFGLSAIGRFEQSLKTSREALDIQKKIKGSDFTTGAIYTAITSNLIDLDSLDQAIESYKALLKFTESSSSDLSEISLTAESGLGFIYHGKQDYESAIRHFLNAEKISLNIFGPKNVRIAATYNGLTNSYLKQGMLEEALHYNRKAIEINSYKNISSNKIKTPLQETGILQIQFVDSYLLRTQILMSQTTSTFDSLAFQEFRTVYQDTEELIEGWVNDQTNNFDIQTLQVSNKKLTTQGIKVYKYLFDHIKAKPEYEWKAWLISEKSKSIVQKMKDRKILLAQNSISSSEHIDELTKTNKLISEIKSIAYQRKLSDSMKSEYFKLLQVKRNIHTKLQKLRDTPFQFIKEFNKQDLNEFLGNERTIIDYYKSANGLFAFVINEDGVKSFQLEERNTLDNLINDLKTNLSANSTSEFAKTSHKVYKYLFKPLEPYIKGKQIIIIPDGSLWDLNFDLLLMRPLPEPENYLLNEFTISYSYSTSYLMNRFKDSKPSTKSGILAFSFNKESKEKLRISSLRNKTRESLPGTSFEVSNLQSKYAGRYFYGEDSNKSTFLRMAGNYQVLHLALHGEVNKNDPNQSALFFSNSAKNDHSLFASELYNLNIEAELAVLSACDSGQGKIYDGEGVMSLGKAFQLAGVKSILISQWEVSDAIAPQIIESFYTYLNNGFSKPESLRKAKLSFLESSNNVTSNPFYWGSFILIGDFNSISIKESPSPSMKVLILSISIIGVLIYLFFKKRFSNSLVV